MKLGIANQSIAFVVVDSAGAGVTSRTHSNFTVTYLRTLLGVPLAATATSVTPASLAAVNTAHTDGGIIHIGNGLYRLDLPDAATAAGADGLIVTVSSDGSGDTVAIESPIEIDNASLGTGPNTVTATVTDGTDPLQNATVRATLNGILKAEGTTNASGEVDFGLAAATYTVSAIADGHTFTPTTRTVTGEQAGTLTNDIEMTALSITASSAGRTTGYYDEVLDEAGNDEAGVVFSLQCTAVPAGSGLALDTKIYTQTSVVPAGSDPPIEYAGLIRGAEYQIGRGNGTNVKFTAPDAASFALPSVKGAE